MSRSGRKSGPAGRAGGWSAIAAVALLGGCGGSGGGSSAAPAPVVTAPPVNQAPSFTSAATASVVENAAGDIYRPTATDPEGSAVTYAISGGADAARFALVNGQLRFATPPNYDLPADADENNVYLVQLSASDGSAASTLDLQVTVTNDKEGVGVHRIATGFDQPMGMVPIPGDNRVFVPERGGRIYLFDPTSGARTLFLTVAVSTAGEGGLAAIAPMADYATSGEFMVLYTSASGGFSLQLGRRSGTFGGPELTSQFAAFATLPAGSSATGWMQLGPDGKIYVATSDALGATDPSNGAAAPGSIFGKLLVVERNPDPYAGATIQSYLTRRIAGGLRFPRGGTFIDGRLLLADRGADTWHELDLVDLTAGGNFGWPYREGTQALRSDGPSGLADPVLEYRYGTGPAMGTGVVSGAVYRGPIASLAGHYLFADRRGEIFTTAASRLTAGQLTTGPAIERRRADFAPDAGQLNQPTAIVTDASGSIYILDAGGDIFRVDPA